MTFASRFSKLFVPGALILPERIAQKKTARAVPAFKAPDELLLDGYCTPVENQEDKPYCAAYAATSFAESVLWRKNNFPQEIDPKEIYARAKEIDGQPDVDGTTLEAALQAVIDKGYLDSKCKVKMFGGKSMGCNDGLMSVKYAVHKYGCCVAGFKITDEWYSPSWFTDTIKGKWRAKQLGGHAVLICGYTEKKVRIMNSWGKKYADDGFVWITNEEFDNQFVYGAVATDCL